MLKGTKVEDEVEYKGENGTIKQVLHKVEVTERRFFVGIEKGVGNTKMMC